MDWLTTTVAKIQSTIQESTDEFLAEQAKFCGEQAARKPDPPPPAAHRDRARADERDGPAWAGLAGIEESLGQVEAWLKDRAGEIKDAGLVLLNPLGDADEELTDAGRRDAGGLLPWEHPGLGAERRTQMQALSASHMAFLTLPPEEAPFSFDLAEAMPTVLRLLEADPQIERWRFLLVPKRSARSLPPSSHPRARHGLTRHARRPPPPAARRISEEDFFRSYFYQLALLAGDVAPPSRRPSPPRLCAQPSDPPPSGHACARSATPSADSVGGSVVSLAAPSGSESEQFELISAELLEAVERNGPAAFQPGQLSACADALVTQHRGSRASAGDERPLPDQRGSAPPELRACAAEASEADSWEAELQAELARIEGGKEAAAT